MSERFIVKHIMFDGWCIYDTINDKYYDYGKNDLELLCNVLNKLNEENYLLKHINQELYDKLQVTMSEKSLKGGEIAILERENKQLKSINQDHKDHLADFYADYDRLEKENKELKQRIKELEIENASQSDAIDGLQGFIAHFDLEEILND